MARRVLRGNRDCVFRSNGRRFVQDRVLYLGLNLLDLLNRLFLSQAIQEEVHIGRGSEDLMVISAEASLGAAVLFRHRQKRCHH